MKRSLILIFLWAIYPFAWAQTKEETALAYSIEELRTSIGLWDVTTEFLDQNGKVMQTVSGTYEFSWVIPDRVAMGKNHIPDLKMASAILFYIREQTGEIEMASVGQDGKLWIMTGPLGGDSRTTQPFESQNGATQQLRFTRYSVEKNRFESKMEFTSDGGKTWRPGNRQIFKRKQS